MRYERSPTITLDTVIKETGKSEMEMSSVTRPAERKLKPGGKFFCAGQWENFFDVPKAQSNSRKWGGGAKKLKIIWYLDEFFSWKIQSEKIKRKNKLECELCERSYVYSQSSTYNGDGNPDALPEKTR